MIMTVIIFFISKRIYWIFLYLSTRTLLTFFLFLYLCFVLSKIFWIPILLVCFCCEVAQIRIPLNRNLDFAGRLFCPTLPLFNFLIVPLFIYDNALLAFFHHFWYTWFPFAIINLSCRFNYLFLLKWVKKLSLKQYHKFHHKQNLWLIERDLRYLYEELSKQKKLELEDNLPYSLNLGFQHL